MKRFLKSSTFQTYSFIIIFIIIILLASWNTIKINLIVFLTLKRGIISQNCFWWKLNDYLPDSTGSEVYQTLKSKGRFVPLNIFGKEIYLVTDIYDIAQLLELSPSPFGPGKIKENFSKKY
jgi:hypothetical protein